MNRSRLPESLHLRQRGRVVLHAHICIDHRAVSSKGRRLAGYPAPRRVECFSLGPLHRRRQLGAVDKLPAPRGSGDRKGVGRQQCVEWIADGRLAQHRVYVLIGERVVRVEGQRPFERAHRLGPWPAPGRPRRCRGTRHLPGRTRRRRRWRLGRAAAGRERGPRPSHLARRRGGR